MSATDSSAAAATEGLSKIASAAAITLTTLYMYVFVTVSSIESQDFLTGKQVKLPVFLVEVSLKGFFAIVPIIITISLLYLILSFNPLLKNIEFLHRHNALRESTSAQSYLLSRIISSVVQRDRRRNKILPTIFLLLFISIPVLLLLFIQINFLPYHSEHLTWLQRICVLLAAVISVSWGYSELVRRNKDRTHGGPIVWSILLIVMLLISLFSAGFVVFPSEKIYTTNIITRVLFEGTVNPQTGRVESLFTNRIILTDWSKFAEIQKGQTVWTSLRGRNLVGGIFDRADLRNTDFTGADISLIRMFGANLTGSRFEAAKGIGAQFENARLGHARFNSAKLTGANFTGAILSWLIFLEQTLKVQLSMMLRFVMSKPTRWRCRKEREHLLLERSARS